MKLLDRRGRAIKTSEETAAAPKASDPARIGDVLIIMQEMNGPIALVLREAMEKIARLEDRLGITDESVAGDAPPTGVPLSPTGGRAWREMVDLYGGAPQESQASAGTPIVPTNSEGGDLE